MPDLILFTLILNQPVSSIIKNLRCPINWYLPLILGTDLLVRLWFFIESYFLLNFNVWIIILSRFVIADWRQISRNGYFLSLIFWNCLVHLILHETGKIGCIKACFLLYHWGIQTWICLIEILAYLFLNLWTFEIIWNKLFLLVVLYGPFSNTWTCGTLRIEVVLGEIELQTSTIFILQKLVASSHIIDF